jgi:hypothetical protein
MIPPWLLRYLPHLVAVLAILALLVGSYRWAYGNGVEAERVRWEATTAEAGERFAEALAEQQLVLTGLERDLTAARRQANRKREDLANATTTDPASRDWALAPIPDGVRQSLGDRRDLSSDP